MNSTDFNTCQRVVENFNTTENSRLFIERKGIRVLLGDENESVPIYSVADLQLTLDRLLQIWRI